MMVAASSRIQQVLETPSLQNVLFEQVTKLDHSTEPFSQQLVQCFSLVGQDAAALRCNFEQSQSLLDCKAKFNPKEEWALRWLLKRFNGTIMNGDDPAMNFEAWLLLRTLLARLPTTVSARLLNELDFGRVLYEALRCIYDRLSPIDMNDLEAEKRIEIDSDRADSNEIGQERLGAEAPIESSTIQASMKRKRTDSVVISNEVPQKSRKVQAIKLAERDAIIDLFKVLLAICSTIEQIMLKIEVAANGSEGFAGEHLKLVFRYDFSRAASVLGLVLRSIALRVVLNGLFVGEVLERQFAIFLCPIIFIWNARENSAAITMAEQVQVFCSTCLIPALEILSANRCDKLDLNTTMLEELLTTYCVFPSYEAYLSSRKLSLRTLEAVKGYLDHLLEPLSCVSKNSRMIGFTHPTLSKPTHCISILFEIFVEGGHQSPSCMRTSNDAWLPDLLECLISCAPLDLSEPRSEVDLRSLQITRELLQLAFNYGVSLRRSFLESVLARLAIPSTVGMQDYWLIVSSCINLVPEIAILDSTFLSQAQPFSTVLQQIDDPLKFSTESAGHDSPCYHNRLHHLALPFLRANIQAHNLRDFLRFWRMRLVEYFRRLEHSDARTSNGGCCLQSIWTDHRLSSEVSASIQDFLTVDQVNDTIRDLSQSFLPEKGIHRNSEKIYASSIILQCIFEGISLEDYHDQLKPVVQFVHELQYQVIKENFKCSIGNKKPWQCENVISGKWPEIYVERGYLQSEADLLAIATDTVLNGLKDPKKLKAEQYEEAYLAFSFIYRQMCHPIRLKSTQDGFDQIMAELLPIMGASCDKLERNCKKKPSLVVNVKEPIQCEALECEDAIKPWESTSNEIFDQMSLVKSCTVILVELPLGLEYLSPLSRKAFLKHSRSHAYYEWCEASMLDKTGACRKESDGNRKYSWLSLWKTVLCSSPIHNLRALSKDIRALQILALEKLCPSASDLQPHFSSRSASFTIFELRQQRFEGWKRQERETIANCVLTLAVCNPFKDVVLRHAFLDLIHRLANNLSDEMTLIKEPITSLRKLGKLYDDDVESEVVRNTSSLQKITSSVIAYILSQNDEQPIVFAIEKALFEDTNSISLDQPLLASMAWMIASFHQVKQHKPHALPIIEDMCTTLLKTLARRFHAILDSKSTTNPTVLAFLDRIFALEPYLRLAPDELVDCLLFIVDRMGPLEDAFHRFHSVELDSDIARDIFNKAQSLLCTINGTYRTGTNLASRASNIRYYISPQAASNYSDQIRDNFQVLEATQKAEFLIKYTKWDELDPHEHELHLLQKIISCQQPHTASLPRDIEFLAFKNALGDLLTRVLLLLERSRTARQAQATAAVLDGILRQQPWAVSQFHSESILSTIVIIASRSGVHSEHGYLPGLFTQLCNILSSILATHRLKLSGRYHLLVDALQALLGGFFWTYSREGTIALNLKCPKKLTGKDSHGALEARHAIRFARIISTICDPTPSAIKGSRHRAQQELRDETKRARNLAGQYMQYVLMEFCSLNLHNQLAPEIRSALNPGIYSIFDAMSHDVRKTLNSALDPPGRSIFRSIYDDYKISGGKKL